MIPFDAIPPFLACEFRIKFATVAWERQAAAALRRQAFCQEQKLFAQDDRDVIDAVAIPLVALSSLGVAHEDVVGTVRIHEAESGVWWGSRLAVSRPYRKVGAIGTSLIRLAVRSAHARGCRRFLAHVQSQNAPLFHALHWQTLEEVTLHGHPHHFMQADLNRYPAAGVARDRFPVAPEAGRVMLAEIADNLRNSRGIAAKADIAGVAQRLGLSAGSAIAVGDDCAAIPDGDGYLLLAIEGFINQFVAADPWFAGWCGVMVNISDVVAMGGRPVAVVDAIWSAGDAEADPILAGLRAAAETFGVPLVGGHTNQRSDRPQLSVAILGRAKRLLTSFDALPGERLVAAIDLRGRYREPFPNWEAATDAPASRLRQDIEILPQLAEAGLCAAAKDISQGGIVGTAMMLAECSSVGMTIDLGAIPRPDGAPLDRWLQTFPSFGYLLSVPPAHVSDVLARFGARGIAAADIGGITEALTVQVQLGDQTETIWDFGKRPLIGCAHA